MEILPKLNARAWLILSGVLRRQQDELVHGLQRNGYEMVSVKRRGKWAAILAQPKTPARLAKSNPQLLRAR